MSTYIRENYNVIKYCLSLSWKSTKIYTLLRLLFCIISPCVYLVSMYTIRYLVNIISNGGVGKKTYIVMLIYVCTKVIDTFFQKLNMFIQQLYSERVRNCVNERVMDVASALELGKFDDATYYDKVQMIGRDSGSIVQALWEIIDHINSMISVIYTVVILISTNVPLLIFFILSSIPSAVINQKYTKSLYHLSLEQLNSERRMNHIFSIFTSKQYSQDVRMFDAGITLKRRYHMIWERMFYDKKEFSQKRFYLSTISDLLNFFMYTLYLLFFIGQIVYSSYQIGDFIFYIGMLDQLLIGIFFMSSSIIRINENKVKVFNVKEFLEDYSLEPKDKNEIDISIIETIEFKNVSFAYPHTTRKVLDNISFKLYLGVKVALVGKNGAGKSTIIKLMLGFYDEYEGEIFINEIDLRNIDKAKYRKSISLCFQKPTIYGFSIKENIILGDAFLYDEKRLMNALLFSELYDTVSSLDQGVDACLTKQFDERGVELSGGQYQKVSLARMFYRQASVVIMDEPTSSIDPEAESNIFDRINAYNDKIIFFVSHRLSNLSIADVIMVLEEGRIENMGSHNELINNSLIYKNVFECQLEKYERMK